MGPIFILSHGNSSVGHFGPQDINLLYMFMQEVHLNFCQLPSWPRGLGGYMEGALSWGFSRFPSFVALVMIFMFMGFINLYI